MQHPILRFMAIRGIQHQSEFAELVELSATYVNDIVHGRKPCGRNGALKIQLATGGAITVQELLMWEKPKPGRGRPKRKGRKRKASRKGSEGEEPGPASMAAAGAGAGV